MKYLMLNGRFLPVRENPTIAGRGPHVYTGTVSIGRQFAGHVRIRASSVKEAHKIANRLIHVSNIRLEGW